MADPDGAALTTLACGTPQRFQIGFKLDGIAATRTPAGIAVVTVDTSGALKGWTYALAGGALAATHENLALGANANGTLGVAVDGAQLVVAASNGSPATGTTLYGVDVASLAPLGAPSPRIGEFAAASPVAVHSDAIAYANQLSTTEVDLRLVHADGTDATPPALIGDASTMPYRVSLVATSTGFALAFGTGAGGHTGQLVLLDPALAITSGPVYLDGAAGYGAIEPVAAYAASSDRFLVAWHQKDTTNDDDVWAEVLDAGLGVVVPPFEVAPFSSHAVISTDGTDFWVSYLSYDTGGGVPDWLAASRISSTGQLTPRTVVGSGGTPNKWALVSLAGQSVLVWTETNGSGPDLYFDPLCGS